LVTVQIGDQEQVLFCKHGGEYVDPFSGHRRGPAYEAALYSSPLLDGVPAPRFYGSFDGPHGTTLVLQWLRATSPLTETGEGHCSPVLRAAATLGRSHRISVEAVANHPQFVNRFDGAHLQRWFSHAWQSIAAAVGDRPAVASLQSCVDVLLTAEVTLVHGELLPANVLADPTGIWFVDWEAAGFGAGEIDLAALTLGRWSDDTRKRCIEAYVAERWGEQPPPAERARIAAAQVHALAFVARHIVRKTERVEWIAAQLAAALEVVQEAT
jgi:aminoglycoside phosphotransferase (APT) family kinase protein